MSRRFVTVQTGLRINCADREKVIFAVTVQLV